MNINLSTVTDGSKATKATLDSGSAEVEVNKEDSSKGFFSKLSAFIKGESTEGEGDKNSKVDSTDSVDITSGLEDSTAEVKATHIENSSTDELLNSEDSEVGELFEPLNGDEISQADKELAANTQTNKSVSTDIEKIVADNEEILNRLNQSNNALQHDDGKALPPEEVSVKDDKSLSKSIQSSDLIGSGNENSPLENLSEQIKNIAKSERPTSDSLSSETILSNDSDSLNISEQAKSFIQQNDSGQIRQQIDEGSKNMIAKGDVPLSTRENTQEEVNQVDETNLNISLDSSIQAHVDKQLDDGVDTSQQQVIGIDSEKNLLQNVDSNRPAETDVQDKELATIANPNLKVSATKVSESMFKTGDNEASVIKPQASNIDSNDTQPLVAMDESAISAVATTAIPWAMNSDDVVLNDDAPLQSKQHSVQQAAIAQSVHQALTQSQANQASATTNLNTASSTPAMNTEAMANQVQAMLNSSANASATPVASEKAMLNVASGAKVVGNLLNQGATKSEKNKGTDSGFAQQLAQAAGTQHVNTPTGQIRAEQAAQVPLQLNREVASDQLAERVQVMMSKNLKNIDIRLDPPELGRMQIRMHMHADGATVHFTVANPHARDALEQAMPRLREMLAQQGVQLGDTSVQQQASSQQQNRYLANGQGHSGQSNGNQAGFGEESLEPEVNLDLNVSTKRDGISYYA